MSTIIRVRIRRADIHIELESTGIRGIIPIAAEISEITGIQIGIICCRAARGLLF